MKRAQHQMCANDGAARSSLIILSSVGYDSVAQLWCQNHLKLSANVVFRLKPRFKKKQQHLQHGDAELYKPHTARQKWSLCVQGLR